MQPFCIRWGVIFEKKNAEATIPLVEYDSSIGWEPSMGYKTDKWRIEWKIRQLEYVIEGEINIGRQGASLQSGIKE